MPVTIRLTNVNDPESHRDLVFTQPVISIGRETSSTLSLSDPLVSKNHARIEKEPAGYRIFDLKSTNATYLNGEKLIPERAYALHQNDEVKIAGYRLEFGFKEETQVSSARPIHPATTISQPDAEMHDAGTGMQSLPGTTSGISQQWAKLKDELVDIARYLDKVDVKELSSRNEELTRLCDELRTENERLKNQGAQAPVQDIRESPVRESPGESVFIPSGELHDILLQAVLKLVRGQLSFRSEFLGMTVLRDSGPVPVDFPSHQDAVRYFADPALGEAEAAARLANLKKAAEQVILHTIGIMEGYKQSAEEGSKSLLQRADPSLLRKEVLKSKLRLGPLEIPYRLLPFLVPFRVLQLAEKRHHDLVIEDRGVLEKRYYRPGFVHGYEACVAQGLKESKVR